MNALAVENLTKSFGERVLFQDITFYIDAGHKVGFVARNGTGKTSLLKIISGLDTADSGTVEVNKNLTLAYLPQEPDLPQEQTVFDAVYRSKNPIIEAIGIYNTCLAHPDRHEDMQAAFEKVEAMHAWDYEVKIKQILSKLNIDRLEEKVSILSGGQQKRIALANVLINEPDFLIMDEPTNHLDLEMIEWLEEFMAKQNLTLLMVTHDRYFLDNVCDRILELDEGKVYKHNGNYAYYLEQKDKRYETTRSNVEKAKGLLRKELEWMRRMPKARGTKAKARIDSFYDLKDKASQRLDDSQVKIQVQTNRLGGKILELHNLGKAYGELNLIEGFHYKFKKYERVGIVGRNGTGKTTFLRLLTEQEAPDTGKVVVGATVKFGHYTQAGIKFKDDHRMIDAVKEVSEVLPMQGGKDLSAAQLLERFLFPRSTHYTPIEKLSGGEKRRLYLLTILMQNPNFLILDEPTNDLDILTLNVLEDFLEDFMGCLVVVTHDRYFMDRLVDHLFVFEGNGYIRDFPGNYTQYRLWQKQQASTKAKPATLKEKEDTPSTGIKQTAAAKGKMGFNEKREFQQLEQELPELETQKEALEAQLNAGNLPHEELSALATALQQLIEQIDQKTDRWLELSELE